MEQKILTEKQILFLDLFSKDKDLSENFYLSGGTALAEYYIPYRLSDDLDFFCEEEFDVSAIIFFLKKNKDKLDYEEFDYQRSFNRNLFFLKFKDYTLKTEFTYYPFPQLDKPNIQNGVRVDSLLDIAVNKVFTISQNSRTRDFIDLYLIIKKKNYDFFDLLKKARIKFDWHVDPIQLGAELMKVADIKEYPILLEKIDDREWQDFYYKIAKKL